MNVNIRTRLNVLVAVAILPLLALAGCFLWERTKADYASARAGARDAAQRGAPRRLFRQYEFLLDHDRSSNLQ
jgi:hypothetical protein